MKRLMEYTTPKTMKLYLLGFAVALCATLLASTTGSNVILALGFSATGLLCWPMIRDLAPVAWSVGLHGRWPTRNT